MAASSLPVRVLVAGAGAFGTEHLARLARRSDVTIAGVADTNPAAFEPISSALGGVKVLTDPLRMIDEVEADAIIVATPAASHVEISMAALGRNLCVLMEKPVAPSAGSAAPLLAAERRSTGFVLPGHVLRFSHDHARMIEIIRSGRIGNVIYVNSAPIPGRKPCRPLPGYRPDPDRLSFTTSTLRNGSPAQTSVRFSPAAPRALAAARRRRCQQSPRPELSAICARRGRFRTETCRLTASKWWENGAASSLLSERGSSFMPRDVAQAILRRRMILCATSTIAFWLACAIVRRRRPSISRKRSPD